MDIYTQAARAIMEYFDYDQLDPEVVEILKSYFPLPVQQDVVVKTDAELRQELTALAGDQYRINVEDGLLDVIPVDPAMIVPGGAITVRNDDDGLRAVIKWLQDRM